jgi:gamma-glutamylcysteine synthetase
MGDTLERRHSLLNAACSAWNIACNMPALRKKQVDLYLKEYRKFNPGADEEEIAGVRSNMEKLIEKKLKMFPNDIRQIVGARIVKVGDKDRIEAVAATVQ